MQLQMAMLQGKITLPTGWLIKFFFSRLTHPGFGANPSASGTEQLQIPHLGVWPGRQWLKLGLSKGYFLIEKSASLPKNA